MTRHRTIFLVAVAAMVLPSLSTLAHIDTGLAAGLEEREISVTGHEERDSTLHMDAASGTLSTHCLECVLDKRKSGAERGSKPIWAIGPSRSRLVPETVASRSSADSESAPARAPPLA